MHFNITRTKEEAAASATKVHEGGREGGREGGEGANMKERRNGHVCWMRAGLCNARS